jgi:hypothetical protein
VAQCALVAQVERHAVTPQAYAPQDVDTSGHAPAPSHSDWCVSTPPAHEFAPHDVEVLA